MSKNAIVTVRVKRNECTVVKLRRMFSSDLPAKELGELVAEALSQSYELGNDPVDTHIVINFN